MIIFRRSGQLGNQIFQIAYALSIRSQCETIIMNDISQFMSCFEPPIGLRNIEPCREGARRVTDPFFLSRLAASVGLIYRTAELHSRDGEVVSVIRNRGLIPITFIEGGWFQDYNVVSQIDQSFPRLRSDVRGLARNWIDNLVVGNKRLIFCHLRRADYLNFHETGINVALPLSYYLEALGRLAVEDHQTKLLISSDDHEFVELAFGNTGWPYTIIREDANTTLAILSMCDAGVISNSSFSWWAGLMVARRGGRVIAPKNWFGWRDGRCAPPTIETPHFEWLAAPGTEHRAVPPSD